MKPLTPRVLVVGLLAVFVWPDPGLAQAISAADGPIDRQALVSRHNIVVHDIDPMGAMAVGNGKFAFNFDVTGLQSFPEYYEKTMPLGILSDWGWHSFPNPAGYTLDKFKMEAIKKNDREFIYPASGTSNPPPDAAYLRGNEHKFGLGRIGLELAKADGTKAAITDLKNIEQKLDLWSGILTSTFEVEGVPVRVQTAAHPQRDEVGVVIESPLLVSGRLKVRIAFPYASDSFGPDYQDWTKPDAHQTVLTRRGETGADFTRTLDATRYNVRAKWSAGSVLTETGPHQYLLSSPGPRLELSAWFRRKRFPQRRMTPRLSLPLPASIGRNFGKAGARLICRATATRVPPSSSGGSCFRNTLWRCRRLVRCRRRKLAWRRIPGSANFTWKCIGGTPRIGRSGAGPRFWRKAWMA